MRTLLVLLLAVAFGAGCRDSARAAIEKKCDASLRQQAEQQLRDRQDDPMLVLGRTDGPVDEKRRDRLSEAGAILGEITDDLFTAQIPPRRLGDVALLAFVTSLQLSQQREPLER